MPDVSNPPRRFLITVNDQQYGLDEPLPKGRDILEAAGLVPVDEHLLFFRQADGMVEEINLAHPVDLTSGGKERFVALRADHLFYLEVDGRRFPWGEAKISGAELRELANIPADRDLFYDPKGGHDDLIEDAEIVSLAGKDVERFYTAERPTGPVLVKVELNGEKIEILSGDYTTEALKEALGVATDWDLDIVDKQGSFRTLQPGEVTTVVAKLKFVSHVRQGGSS